MSKKLSKTWAKQKTLTLRFEVLSETNIDFQLYTFII